MSVEWFSSTRVSAASAYSVLSRYAKKSTSSVVDRGQDESRLQHTIEAPQLAQCAKEIRGSL